MKVCILFTGALRTIRKTIKYFKKNVLLNQDVNVFACIQNDTTIPNPEWEEWLRQEMGTHLKSIEWFSPSEHQDWISIRDKALSSLNLVQHWKDYLKNSGSIIEYYQLYLAYLKMCQFEDTHYRFNYIIRSRTDSIFAKPIDFHWLQWSDEQVQERLNTITSHLTTHNIDSSPSTILNYFMTTIISDDLIPNIHNINAECKPHNNLSIPTNPSDLNTFIKNGNYILTLRANNLYICNRESFNFIPTIPFVYGLLKTPISDDYWFNSENQFQSACYLSGLTIFNYCTTYEDKSLYEYNESNYFDSNYDIINPFMLFCLVRN
jgi:hypothetical protein